MVTAVALHTLCDYVRFARMYEVIILTLRCISICAKAIKDGITIVVVVSACTISERTEKHQLSKILHRCLL